MQVSIAPKFDSCRCANPFHSRVRKVVGSAPLPSESPDLIAVCGTVRRNVSLVLLAV